MNESLISIYEGSLNYCMYHEIKRLHGIVIL